MFHLLKRWIPKSWLDVYHRILAHLAAAYYAHPSHGLIVIGVTGTNGKTTTCYYLAKVLEASGEKTGCTTTAVLKIGDQEWLNRTKMTMPGRFWLQRFLRRMRAESCKYAVIKTSSQGLIQHRDIGVEYDVGVFTNLTPEHIEAHGGFEKYKKAKRILFEDLARLPLKVIAGVPVQKTAVLNADDEHAAYYAETPGLKHVAWFGVNDTRGLQAVNISLGESGSTFEVKGVQVCLNQPGLFNIKNALAALSVCEVLGIDLAAAAEKLSEIRKVPGRLERVEEGQPYTVIIDYAPEPESFRQLYEALSFLPRNKTIHVLGSCGGGRDMARRPILGKLAAEHADIVVVTNEDPYDDDPIKIIDQVAEGALAAGKELDRNLFTIPDREEAIRKAISLAEEGDLVVLTGKGCEPYICVAGGKKLPWDEAKAVKEAIQYVSRS